jgi:hypothetical protein
VKQRVRRTRACCLNIELNRTVNDAWEDCAIMDLLWFRLNAGRARSRLYTRGKRNRGSDVQFNNGHLSRPGNLPDPRTYR